MSNLSNLSLNLLVEQVYLEGRVHMMYESIIKEDSNVDNESKSIVKQVVSDMKLNADFMMTYGLGISAFVGPVMELLHNKNINVTKYDATLLIMTASYILLSKSKDDLSKLSDELKKRGIFNELKDVMKIINGSIGLFKTIGKKVGVTVTTLLDVLSFTFMSVPVLNVLKDIAAEKGFSADNMNELVTGLALSAGSYGLKNLLGKKTVKESVDDFGWAEDVIDDEYIMNGIISKFLNTHFEGFSDTSYSWANFNCGMGECCDMYAVGFVLPSAHYDDYLFKLVDGNKYREFGKYDNYPDDLPEPCYEQPNINDPAFDTILISEELYEEMVDHITLHNNWKDELLKVLNKTFNMNAKKIRLQYE